MSASNSTPPKSPINAVACFLRSIPNFNKRASHAIRQAIDEVIDGARTGRWAIEQLEKVEKTYIGTKIEIIFRDEFELPRGNILDNMILGFEIDTKFSLRGRWEIPKEAVDKLCLVIKGDDATGKFSIGIVLAAASLLNLGSNQDGKKTLSAAGRRSIHWIVQSSPLEPNFFLKLPNEVREKILSTKNGQARVTQLFRLVKNKRIPRYTITLLGQQIDPMKRARDARKKLALEGISVLCGRYDQAKIIRHGFKNFKSDDWISIG